MTGKKVFPGELKMNRVGIRVHASKVDRIKVDELAGWLEGKGVKTVVLSNRTSRLPRGLDMLIVMGGDGTLLGGARAAALEGVPVIGIDFGGLGFLSEIKYRDAKSALSKILAGDCRIEERMMIEAGVECGGECRFGPLPAVNDIIVTKSTGRMLRLKVFINDEYFTEFPGDGLIVSSATGSTAYSLSAGGPIVRPELDVLLLTSICPHTLFERALVTGGGDVVRVELPAGRKDLIMMVDGQEQYALDASGTVTVRRGPKPVRYVRVKPSRFLSTVREKFHLT
jgi:NAD+ kinase